MPSITLAEMTYQQVDRVVDAPGKIRRNVLISFPTGANAGTNNLYAAGGVAVDKGALGCPRRLQRLDVIGIVPVTGASNPGWIWNADGANPKLVAMTNATAGSGDQEMAAATAIPPTQQLYCEVEGY